MPFRSDMCWEKEVERVRQKADTNSGEFASKLSATCLTTIATIDYVAAFVILFGPT